MSHTYLRYNLKCSDDSFYVGSTTDLDNRFKAHSQRRDSSYTAKRGPVQLLNHERIKSLDDAVKRERQIKKWSRAKKEALINGELKTLKKLSKRRDI